MAPIHEAVKTGDLATLKELLVHDRSLVDAPDDHKRSPLRLAAQYAQVKVAEILLAAGASTRGVGPNSNTPLHEAAYSGSLPIVERLLQASASPNARNVHGCTPLHFAAERGNVRCLERLIEAGGKVGLRTHEGASVEDVSTGLCVALLRDARSLARAEARALGQIASPRRGDEPDYDKLFRALSRRSLKEAQMAIVQLGNKSLKLARTETGETPLHVAAAQGSYDIANFFLAVGPKGLMHQVDNNGNTPLHLAAHTTNTSMVDRFISEGANVNQTNRYGQTPMHLAALYGQAVVLEHLVRVQAANWKQRDGEGRNVLDTCSTEDCKKVIVYQSPKRDRLRRTLSSEKLWLAATLDELPGRNRALFKSRTNPHISPDHHGRRHRTRRQHQADISYDDSDDDDDDDDIADDKSDVPSLPVISKSRTMPNINQLSLLATDDVDLEPIKMPAPPSPRSLKKRLKSPSRKSLSPGKGKKKSSLSPGSRKRVTLTPPVIAEEAEQE